MIKNAFAGFLVVIFPIAFVGELINMFFKSNGIYLSGNQQGVLFFVLLCAFVLMFTGKKKDNKVSNKKDYNVDKFIDDMN
jgi:uncharacterized membrane protein